MTDKEALASDEARLEWLLEFLRVDLAEMKPGRLLDLRNEVFANLLEAVFATLTSDDPDWRALRPAHAVESDPVVALARDLLLRTQRDLKTGVEALARSGGWRPFGITPSGSAPGWSLEKRIDGTVCRAYVGHWKMITVAAAADLLASRWLELRFCAYEGCGQLFLPEEGRQKYHVPKCSADARRQKFASKRDKQKEKERKALRNGPGRGRKKR